MNATNSYKNIYIVFIHEHVKMYEIQLVVLYNKKTKVFILNTVLF